MSVAEQASFNFHSFTSHLDKIEYGSVSPITITFCISLDIVLYTNTDHGHGKAADLEEEHLFDIISNSNK